MTGFRITANVAAEGLIGEELEQLFAELLGPKIQEGAKRLVPVRLGNLKAAIVIQVHLDGAQSVLQVGVDPEAEGRPHPEEGPTDYGPFVELGTSKAPAQPFLKPALLQAGVRPA
jgi:HK97 gp10 family phage protein